MSLTSYNTIEGFNDADTTQILEAIDNLSVAGGSSPSVNM
jgi:hypothetical protein